MISQELEDAYKEFLAPEAEDEGPSSPPMDDVAAALRTPVAERTSGQVETIFSATSHVKFFKLLADEPLHRELCRQLLLEEYDNGKTVCEQGAEGARFYVILHGTVRVLKNYSSASHHEGVPVCVLGEGDSFGELALLGRGTSQRSATVVADCSGLLLLALPYEAYATTLRRRQQRDQDERARCLEKVFLFSHWSRDDRNRLAAVMRRRRYGPNEVVIRQGASTECLYFVLAGRCRVLQAVELSAAYENRLHSEYARRQGSGVRRLMGEGGDGNAPSPRSALPSPRASQLPSPRAPMPSPRSSEATGEAIVLEVGELREGQFFGELALCDPSTHGKHTASVVTQEESHVEVLVLSRVDFFRLSVGDLQDPAFHESLLGYGRRFYASLEQIKDQIRRQCKWEKQKRTVVREAHLSLTGPPSPRA